MLLCVSVFLKLWLQQKPLCGASLDIICYNESLKTDIQKKPRSVTRKDILVHSTVINSFVSAYDSTTQDLAARFNQK